MVSPVSLDHLAEPRYDFYTIKVAPERFSRSLLPLDHSNLFQPQRLPFFDLPLDILQHLGCTFLYPLPADFSAIFTIPGRFQNLVLDFAPGP